MVGCLVHRGGMDGPDVRVGWGCVRMSEHSIGRVSGQVGQDGAAKEQEHERGTRENLHVARFGRRRSVGYTRRALPSVAPDPCTFTHR